MPDETARDRFLSRGYSICVSNAYYDPVVEELIIHFQKRGTYLYRGVPADEAAGLIGATSQGTYFNLYIRDQYMGERIG